MSDYKKMYEATLKNIDTSLKLLEEMQLENIFLVKDLLEDTLYSAEYFKEKTNEAVAEAETEKTQNEKC